jgi:hypothetical protein
MFNRVNQKGGILNPALAVSDVDAAPDTTSAGVRDTVMRMKDLPTPENWKEIRMLFASMCEQVRRSRPVCRGCCRGTCARLRFAFAVSL